MENVKDAIPFNVGMFTEEFLNDISQIKSPKEFEIKHVKHSFANEFVFHHHYLRRKLYIARNVSYGLFLKDWCVGVCMFGYPVWREYPGLVPPMSSAECPELVRLCTISGLPKNTESYFVSKCLKNMSADWKIETGSRPKCVTSLCDNAIGFDGAIYKATNFSFFKKTKGRASNPGGAHGKWGANTHKQNAEKTMWVYWVDRRDAVA